LEFPRRGKGFRVLLGGPPLVCFEGGWGRVLQAGAFMAETVFVADIGTSKISAAILDRDGKVLARRTESLDASATIGPVKQIVRIASELAQARDKYSAAGIAVAGIVRSDGTACAPDLPGWEKLPLTRLLQTKLRVPVVVESNNNAAVLGETWRGAGRGKHDVVVLTVGVTVGAGIISGGRLLLGAHRLSGSAGWMAVSEADGFEVRKFGGVEAFASEPAIVRTARNAVVAGCGGALAEFESDAFTAEDIADLARRGDATCKQIYRRAGKLLGLAVANLVNLFDPEVVVFGGPLVAATDLFWDELTHTALSRCHPMAARQVRIRISGLGEDANLHGAGYLAWQSANIAASPPVSYEDPHQVSAKKVKKKLSAARAHAVAR
jgi:glucokinase